MQEPAETTPLTRVADWAAAAAAAAAVPGEPQPSIARRVFSNVRARVRSRVVVLCLLAIVAAFVAVLMRAPESRVMQLPALAEVGSVRGTHGAVAADDVRCSEIGVHVLRKLKGNAADATVAALLCQGAVAPFGSGIGGGAFILVHKPGEAGVVYDARETAPAAVDADAYDNDPKMAQQAGPSVAVPGELMGLYELHRNHGVANWSDLVMLSVPLAEKSVVSNIFVRKLKQFHDAVWRSPSLLQLLKRNGSETLLNEGDLYRNDMLALTLRAVARQGPSALYEDRAEAIANAVQKAGGVLTAADVREYRVVKREPVVSDYRGYTVLGAPLPSAGGASVAMALNILEGAALAQRGRDGASYAYIAEALKHVFAWRSLLGEPKFTYGARHAVRQMLDKSLARRLQRRIEPGRTFPPSHYARDLRFARVDRGTTHVSVADGSGMSVAATSTINLSFGAGVVAAGVLLNNEMDDFSASKYANFFGLSPSIANRIQPGKRPLSSMSPTIVLRNNRPVLVVGASGGPRIITATLQTILNVLDWRDSIHDAVAAPRLHHQLLPNVLHLESVNTSCAPTRNTYKENDTEWDYWPGVCLALKRAGHVLDAPSHVGIAQAIFIQEEADGEGGMRRMMYAASDPRKFGKAEAY